MQKLKNSILDHMIDAKLTSKEIDFLIFISRFQDDTGRVCGVHYRELCEEMHMSYQTFYNVKESLEEKNFIRSIKTDRIDHDIIILNNRNEDCIENGYINTNHHMLFCEEFYRMKAGAKLLAMQLMKITYAGKGYFAIGVRKFYDGYPARFGVSRRVMRSWLMSLKLFFSIGIKDAKYFIEPKKIIYRKADEMKESDRLRMHNADVILRRNRIKEADKKEKESLRDLFRQYEPAAKEIGKSIVDFACRAVKKSLELLNEGHKKTQKIINIKLIHKLLREDLEQEGWRSEPPQASGVTRVQHAAEGEYKDKKKEKAFRKNSFHNFHGRSYDYDELERMLLNTNPIG